MKVLVTYASKYGSTAEIAKSIHQQVASKGIDTDFSEIGDLNGIEIYDAIIVGSAIYNGAWTKAAMRFLKKNKTALSEKKIWIFSSGPISSTKSTELLFEWKMPRKLFALAMELNVKEVRVFPGSISMDKLSEEDRKYFEKKGAPEIDSRNWEEINDWSNAVSDEIKLLPSR